MIRAITNSITIDVGTVFEKDRQDMLAWKQLSTNEVTKRPK